MILLKRVWPNEDLMLVLRHFIKENNLSTAAFEIGWQNKSSIKSNIFDHLDFRLELNYVKKHIFFAI